jgi:hypothetical protein
MCFFSGVVRLVSFIFLQWAIILYLIFTNWRHRRSLDVNPRKSPKDNRRISCLRSRLNNKYWSSVSTGVFACIAQKKSFVSTRLDSTPPRMHAWILIKSSIFTRLNFVFFRDTLLYSLHYVKKLAWEIGSILLMLIICFDACQATTPQASILFRILFTVIRSIYGMLIGY